MTKSLLLAGAAALALAAASVPAHAGIIVENQWYTGHFGPPNTPLLGGNLAGGLGVNGPILPPPAVGDAVDSPDVGGILLGEITLRAPQWLTVTDVEISGDQFQMFVNGVPATPAPIGANGLVPPGQASYNGLAINGLVLNGLTSLPVPNGSVGCGEDISCALADANHSSGTFLLLPGVNVITGQFLGVINNGNMNYIVTSPVPEPATLSLLGFGVAGLSLLRRRRQRATVA
jgi:hypothetical protein